ncbi:MAG TPA: hypothetical protein VK421_15550 [Pyrinomonadaceae bacterium]|nr:hypothetical protein [Pyrinomonadaceae bacterium]
MSNGNPGEVPIIIQGGNSVDVEVPSKFKENGSGKQGGKFRNPNQNLISLTIDGGEPIALQANSRIEITYGTRS